MYVAGTQPGEVTSHAQEGNTPGGRLASFQVSFGEIQVSFLFDDEIEKQISG